MNGAQRSYYATREPLYPTKGVIYTNENGCRYQCINENLTSPTMRNTATGWTFIAVGTGIYCDGRIDWDYSKKGHFEKPNGRFDR